MTRYRLVEHAPGAPGLRWLGLGTDLLQLEKNGPLDGGEQLRQRLRELRDPRTKTAALQFKSKATIQARDEALEVEIDSEGRSWALASELLERYAIPNAWDANQRRILIGALDVAPTYRDDSVQASVGWPLFTMTLQTANQQCTSNPHRNREAFGIRGSGLVPGAGVR